MYLALEFCCSVCCLLWCQTCDTTYPPPPRAAAKSKCNPNPFSCISHTAPSATPRNRPPGNTNQPANGQLIDWYGRGAGLGRGCPRRSSHASADIELLVGVRINRYRTGDDAWIPLSKIPRY